MQTEYQLRLKDMHLQERVKEVTEKFTAELEADRQKLELLVQEKNEQEMEFEDKLKQVRDVYRSLSLHLPSGASFFRNLQAEGRSQSQLSNLDTQYQAKIMAEVERYQQLTQEKELLSER